MRERSMFRAVATAAVAAVVLAGCTTGTMSESSSSSPSQPTTSTVTTPPSSVASTLTESSTTTQPRPTTTTLALPSPVIVEPLEPTVHEGEDLVWVRSDAQFDRDRQYWLGVHGDEFVLFSWDWPVSEPMVQRSPDGLDWSEPTPLRGVPTNASPVEVWRWDRGISAAAAGLIGLFDITDHEDDRQAGHRVFTSADGVEWSLETLPEVDEATEAAGPFGVAAADDGYAVWLTTDERRPSSDSLFVRPLDGEWRRVDLPMSGTTIENWVVPTNDGFLVRVAELPQAHEGTHPVYHVTVDGIATTAATPSDQPPVRWEDSHVTYNPYNTVPRPSLYGGPDANTWYRLPTPDFTIDNEEEYWSIDALTAGQAGITVAGCPCGEYWGLFGESFVTIEVDTGDHHITVQGDLVTVDGIWDHPIRVDTSAWFDEATGTLNVPDPETGDPIATATCDQMRASAQAKMYQSELLTPPPQDLLYSPDGTAWNHQYVDDLFGDGSYIDHAATLNDTIAVLVDPTGARPTSDPPGCPLDIYPEARPFEVWIATATTGTASTTTAAQSAGSPTTTLVPTVELGEGLSCHELIALGYSYPDAVAYWLGENDQGHMIDHEAGDTLPCESAYARDDIDAYWRSQPVASDQFAYLVSADPTDRTIVADYADWFTGDDAQRACENDGNDDCDGFYTRLYYIRNTNPRQRTLRLTPDAVIALGREDVSYDLYLECEEATPPILDAVGLDWTRFSSISGCVVAIDDLAESLERVSYEFPQGGLKVWLTANNGEVSAIQTQYVP